MCGRNAGLEEELRSYKKYMKDTVVQYKKQVREMHASSICVLDTLQIKTLQGQLSDQAITGTLRDEIGSRENKGGSRIPDKLPRILLQFRHYFIHFVHNFISFLQFPIYYCVIIFGCARRPVATAVIIIHTYILVKTQKLGINFIC